MRIASLLGCFGCLALAACSGLPIAGPTANEVVEQGVEHDQIRYDLVDIDQHVVSVLAAQKDVTLHGSFERYGKPPPSTIGVGDAVTVTVWQVSVAAPPLPGATSAAAPASVGTIALPTQIVGPDGCISIPYAGRIHVSGGLPTQVERAIEQRLAKVMVGVQAIVTVTSVHDVVSVGGEVVNGTRVPLPLNGLHVLDVIAAAGGAKAPTYDTYVRLTRHGTTVTVPLEQVISDPSENVYAWPGDVVTLVARPKSFIAFGATGQNKLLNIDREDFTLAKAVGEAGGLIDDRADPTGVFLLRYEPPAVVRGLHTADLATGPNGSSPVIFRLDLRDPKGYLLAQSFPVQDNDILYVANAPLTVTQKLLTLLNTLSGPIISGVAVTRP
jgi:polysaccharide export outer membrane protein